MRLDLPPCGSCGSEPLVKRTKRGRVTTIVVAHPDGVDCEHVDYCEQTRSSLQGLAVKCATRAWTRICGGGEA